VSINGQILDPKLHAMAVTELKAMLMDYTHISDLNPEEQCVLFEFIEIGICSYMDIIADDQLRKFESEMEH